MYQPYVEMGLAIGLFVLSCVETVVAVYGDDLLHGFPHGFPWKPLLIKEYIVPTIPMLPERDPDRDEGASDIPQPSPASSADGVDVAPRGRTLRERVLHGMAQLPSSCRSQPPLSGSRIPMLYDGAAWHYLDVGGVEHYVVCGASRSGKGNWLQLLALTSLSLGPETCEVWILDPKSGLDYLAFGVHVPHARLYADITQASARLDEGYRAAVARCSSKIM